MGPFLSFLCFHPRMQHSASVSSLAFYFLMLGNSDFHTHYWKNYTWAGQKMWFPSHISPFGKDILTCACMNPKASGASKPQMIITSAFLLWLKRQNTKYPLGYIPWENQVNCCCPKFSGIVKQARNSQLNTSFCTWANSLLKYGLEFSSQETQSIPQN